MSCADRPYFDTRITPDSEWLNSFVCLVTQMGLRSWFPKNKSDALRIPARKAQYLLRNKPLSLQSKVNLDLSNDFDGLAIEERRPVNPLLHGFLCRLNEHWGTADHLQIPNGAVFAY